MGLSDEKPSVWQNHALKRDAAAGVLATLAFFLSAMVIPVAGIVIGVFTPLPTAVFYYRWGHPVGYCVPGSAALAGALLLHIFDVDQGIPYFLEMIAMGLFMGMGMHRQWSAEKIVASASLFVCLMGAAILSMSYTGGTGGLLQYLEEDLQRSVNATFDHYTTFSGEKDSIESAIRELIPTVLRLLPGITISSALVTCWLNMLLARRYCLLRSFPLPAGPSWTCWKAPEKLVWLVIASGFSFLLPHTVVQTVALNLLVVLATVYLFQGYAIAGFFFDRWRLPRALRAVIYALFLLQQFATLAAALMGFFDVWLDFRRLSQKAASDA